MSLKVVLSICIAGLLTACAAPTSNVVARGDDMYTVTRQGASAGGTTDSLKIAAIQEAASYCIAKGRKFQMMLSKVGPAGPYGKLPDSWVLFKCE